MKVLMILMLMLVSFNMDFKLDETFPDNPFGITEAQAYGYYDSDLTYSRNRQTERLIRAIENISNRRSALPRY